MRYHFDALDRRLVLAASCLLLTLLAPGGEAEAASGAAPAAATVAPVPRIKVGQEAPAFSLRSLDGTLHSPADLRGSRNLVLVFFRGTW